MINYLQIEGLTKSYGETLLFGDVSFSIAQGDKIGLIARNGAGKSTMLKIIAGLEDYDSGNFTFRSGLRIGYLSQNPEFDPSLSILENFKSYAPEGDDNWQTHAREMMGKVGIHNLDVSIQGMSGGQLKRLALARVLFSNPDVLMLDEPTNHLDIDLIEWLEGWLSSQKTTLLMVTHDRYFLDRVCNRIIEIDAGGIFSYSGNYDYYLEKRRERMENLSAMQTKVKNLLRTELEWMRRQPQARGSKAKYRIDNFYELEQKSKQFSTPGTLKASTTADYIGSKIFHARGVTKSFGDVKILDNWSYDFARYEKVGIIGNNGAGKTTFLRLLLGEITPDVGSFDIGQTVKFGYYSQNGMTGFDEKKKVIDAVKEYAETVRIDDKTVVSASTFLSMFLFTVEEQQKYIYRLSGGERRRLYLATVLMQRPNFLILDEPTNDLDIVTLSVLEQYLTDFKGCLIVVSHDRFFMDRIVDHLFVFEGDGKLRDFPGNYSEYRHCQAMQQAETKRLQKEEANRQNIEKGGNVKPRYNERKGLTFKETREKENLEARLPLLLQERIDLETKMSSGTLDNAGLLSHGNRIAEIIKEIDEMEMRLLELMDKE